MNIGHSNSKLNTQIYEEACEWLVHFRAGDADHDLSARAQLDEWLRRSPEHVRAYLEVSALWEDLPLHDAEHTITAEAHIARALSEQNVYPLEFAERAAPLSSTTSPGLRPPSQSDGGRRSPKRFAWAASALIALGIGVTTWYGVFAAPSYATAVGEQRSITLDDGSRVELNARSRVRVQFSDRTRSVDLLEGQALFRVAKDPTRPFVVSSGATRVRAVGTQFDVNRRKSATTVTVIEGKVAVLRSAAYRERFAEREWREERPGRSTLKPPPGADKAEVLLAAGDQLTVTKNSVARPKRANVAAATAWTQQQLVFDSVPLAEVAEEFNRYNKHPIVIQDKALESFGVIGVFSSTDPASLLRFLGDQPEIDVIEKDSEIWITHQ